jgi:hypothetical protein
MPVASCPVNWTTATVSPTKPSGIFMISVIPTRSNRPSWPWCGSTGATLPRAIKATTMPRPWPRGAGSQDHGRQGSGECRTPGLGIALPRPVGSGIATLQGCTPRILFGGQHRGIDASKIGPEAASDQTFAGPDHLAPLSAFPRPGSRAVIPPKKPCNRPSPLGH